MGLMPSEPEQETRWKFLLKKREYSSMLQKSDPWQTPSQAQPENRQDFLLKKR